jgi:FtsH-binding integral membrane protein
MSSYDPPRIFDDAQAPPRVSSPLSAQVQVNKFIANVFIWMVLGLLITGATAYYFATSGAIEMMFNLETGSMNLLGWVITLSPLAFILVMNFGLNRLSKEALWLLFLAFSAVMGMSLSYIFLIYTQGSIASVFLITSLTFAVMAVVGYTTQTDLTRFGSLLMMALVGLIIASVVNIFMESTMMEFVISAVGVLIFTGLIAYDTQKLKRIGSGVEYGSAEASKLAILGATSLYLDFINLFLHLLRLLGRRE